MPKFNSQGTKLQVEDPGTPGTFLDIPGVVDFNGPNIDVAEIDATTLDSTAREFLPGLGDNGDFSTTFYPDLQDANTQRIFNDIDGRVTRTYRIQFSDNLSTLPGAPSTPTIFEFDGFVRGAPMSGGVDAIAQLGLTIRIASAITYTFGAP